MIKIPSLSRFLTLAIAAVGMSFLTGCFPSKDEGEDTSEKTEETAPAEADTGEKAKG